MQRPDIHIEHLAQLHQWMESDVLSEKVQLRLRCILHYLEHDASMAETATLFHTTPKALHRWLSHFDPQDPSSLEDKSHRPHTVRTSDIPANVAHMIREYRIATPKMGKEEIALKLEHDHGVRASASAIGRVIERDSLYFADSPLHRRKRLRAHLALSPSPVELGARTKPLQTPVRTYHDRKKLILSSLLVGMMLVGMVLGYSKGKEIRERSQASIVTSLLEFITHYEP